MLGGIGNGLFDSETRLGLVGGRGGMIVGMSLGAITFWGCVGGLDGASSSGGGGARRAGTRLSFAFGTIISGCSTAVFDSTGTTSPLFPSHPPTC